MSQQKVDDDFWKIAMSFFIAAGHITSREPEYFNLKPYEIASSDSGSRRRRLEGQFRILELCDNISLLFAIRQCMFFSLELLSDRNHRSKIAHDIHEQIQSMIEMKASICIFLQDDEVMISFMGYGDKCILSDWYSVNDRMEELADRLDISNVTLHDDYDYFCDLAYSMSRDYYHYGEITFYDAVPVNGINSFQWKWITQEQLENDIRNNIDSNFLLYDHDYVPYDETERNPVFDTTYALKMMLRSPIEIEDNPFGDKVETDKEEDDFFADAVPEESKNEMSVSIGDTPASNNKKKKSASLHSNKQSTTEYISIGGQLVKRQTQNTIPEKKKSKEVHQKKNEKEIVERDKNKIQRTRENDKKRQSLTPYEKKDPLIMVEQTLFEAKKDLDLYEIQDKCGINNLDIIISALELLIQNGKVIRSWSRTRGGRSVYRINRSANINKTLPNRNKSQLIVKRSLASTSKSNDESQSGLSNTKVKDEVIRILKMMELPMDSEGMRRKSQLLSSVSDDILKRVLIDLYAEKKILRLWMGSSKKFLYEINDVTSQMGKWLKERGQTKKK